MSEKKGTKKKVQSTMNIVVPKKYVIDGEKIKNLEDLKFIISLLNIHFTPPSDEIYEKYKHLLSEVSED